MPHLGCPCSCSFCNQKRITGQINPPSINDIISAVETSVKYNPNTKNTELAFFGGSFTAIDKKYRLELLSVGKELVERYSLKGIRISTRPDCINKDILKELKEHKVSAIELGAQSMNDEVLLKNSRGHDSNSVVKASQLIKNEGFELGLQIMTGLYGSNEETDIKTALEVVKLRPNTLRVYPTLVFKGTQLCDLYESGEYKPQTLNEAVRLCAYIAKICENENIKIIRMGLHDSQETAGAVAGPYHPSFSELCQSYNFYELMHKKLKELKCKTATFYVNDKDVSKAIGQKRENIEKLKKLGYNIKVKQKEDIPTGECKLEIEDVT